MSKLEKDTIYYGLFEKQELVRVLRAKDPDNICLIETLDGRAFEFWIKKEKFALLGLCNLVVGPIHNPALPDCNIFICPLSEWKNMDHFFKIGRNGPLNLPRIL
jgi:hypothetical protein